MMTFCRLRSGITRNWTGRVIIRGFHRRQRVDHRVLASEINGVDKHFQKAFLVLLDYNRYGAIQSRYMHVIELLNLADKMDTVLHLKEEKLEPDYFSKYRNIKFSGAAMDLFQTLLLITLISVYPFICIKVF